MNAAYVADRVAYAVRTLRRRGATVQYIVPKSQPLADAVIAAALKAGYGISVVDGGPVEALTLGMQEMIGLVTVTGQRWLTITREK